MIKSQLVCDECGQSLNGHAIFIDEDQRMGHEVRLIFRKTNPSPSLLELARRHKVTCGEQCAFKRVNKILDGFFERAHLFRKESNTN